MTKDEYFESDPLIGEFVEWMGRRLDDDTFEHNYVNRKTGQAWTCESLYDAHAKYNWSHPAIPRLGVAAGSSFASNSRALECLKQDLDRALQPVPSDQKALVAAIDVMNWGGVRAGNVSWLNANERGLAALLIANRNALNAGAATVERFNAGMTKVYSLICKDFIIYDSRVGAALGWAVAKFCEMREALHGPVAIPAGLSFPWAPAKEAKGQLRPKRRYPGVGHLTFPRLRSGPTHAEWNLNASYVLRSILEHANAANSRFKQLASMDEQLRAFEAALFMIGYCLPQGPEFAADRKSQATSLSRPANEPLDHLEDALTEPWISCWTRGKGKKTQKFSYRIVPEGIAIKDGKPFTDASIDATLNRLLARVGSEPFPLANSATEVRKGTADKRGLGTAYFTASASHKNPPDTSRLAAILEEIGAFTAHAVPNSKSLHWTLNRDALGLEASNNTVRIRTLLDKELAIREEA